MRISRRDFLRYSASAGTAFGVSSHLTGCALNQPREPFSDVTFRQGVASGDPLHNAIVIWTRAHPEQVVGVEADNPDTAVDIGWEMAEDANFTRVVRSGVMHTNAGRDYTVKVDVRELDPGTDYFYRFLGKTQTSASGRARTLPEGQVDRVRLAVFSCSNYPGGYFHAYKEASALPDIDAFLHLGDYLYEYGAGGYATEDAAEMGREFAADNAQELISLGDYRRRYALYRGDADLQTVHAAAPMIVVWDDHEIANDTWMHGAQNHQPEEGDFGDRRAAAVQAYFEWMPLRPLIPDADGRIYRSASFGDLVSLHMLDTRLIGRDEPLHLNQFRNDSDGSFDVEGLVAALSDPSRDLLGEEQRLWLYGAIKSSSAHWQVLGQQILMARMMFPLELLGLLFSERSTSEKIAAIKAHIDAEDDVESPGVKVPYNLDAWDGYPMERERLYSMLRSMEKSAVVLAGDTHNAWYSELADQSGASIGVELATPGVSSPGMESYLKLGQTEAADLAAALPAVIDELQYCELANRGFLEIEFTAESCRSIWHFIDDVKSANYTVSRHEVVIAKALT